MNNRFLKDLIVILFCSLSGTTFSLHAQETTCHGRIINVQGKPIEFVNVVLYSLPDTTFIAGTITNEQGIFSIAKTGHIIKCSSLGYHTVYILPTKLSHDIVMKESTEELEEIVIKGNLPKYKLTGEGMKSRIKGTSLSQAGTANDVLRQLPMLQEEGDGFSVFGKGAPVFYINGRRMRDLSELEQIKSEDIQQVEIITDPGARYEASVKSVIRIKTTAPLSDHWGVSFYTDYFQWKKEDFANQLDVNYRKKEWDFFGSIRFTHDNYFTKSKVSQAVYVDTIWNQQNMMYNEGMNQQIITTGGFNYVHNDSNQIGSRIQIKFPFNQNENSNIESLVLANGQYFDRWTNEEVKRTLSQPVYDYNLYYSGKKGKWTIDLNFDAMWSGTKTHSTVKEESQEQDDRLVQSTNDVNNYLFSTRLIFGHPIGKGQFRFGAEHSFINRRDDYINEQQIVPTSYSKLKENQWGMFMEYGATLPIGILKGGLRYECEDFNYYTKDVYQPDQSKSYHQLFPSVSFATRLGKVDLQIAYNSKIHRPRFNQLSNNVFYGNRYTLQTGNPHLKSSRSNSISAMGMWKMLQFATEYKVEKDAIIYFAEQLESNSAITKVMFKNINRLPTATAFISINPVWGIWSPTLSVGVQKQWLKMKSNDIEFSMNRPLWNFKLNQRFKFRHNWLLTVNTFYQTCGDYQNVYLNTDQFMLDISLSKSFCNNAITVQLKGYDLLDGYRDGNLLYSKQSHLDLYNKNDKRRIGISFRYRFNTIKKNYKGGKFSEENKNRL